MLAVLRILLRSLFTVVRSRTALLAEIVALRHQLGVLQRERGCRPSLTRWDRALWAFGLIRWSGWKTSLVIVKPETVMSWHRRAFRLLWRLKSRRGRPSTGAEIRRLIRQMAADNPTWGAPRIHGELRSLGFRVSERTVSRYLERTHRERLMKRSQTWRSFLKNQAKAIACIDMFTVPTACLQVLYVLVIMRLNRRRLEWAAVTRNPTAAWLGQQMVNAFPWDTAPKFVIRDRDGAFGHEFDRRVDGLGTKQIRTTYRAPLMNCYAERVVGSLRRECFDHVIVWNEQHARVILREYVDYFNADRTHLSLGKDSPDGRDLELPGRGEVVALPRVGGLHHRYTRRAA